jgi:hypothetical protein
MIRLFTSYYVDKDPERDKELKECLRRNTINNQIEEIHLLNDFEQEFHSDKIKTVLLKSRPSYGVFFDYINSLNHGAEDVSIIANSDIYFEDLSALSKYEANQVLALCRYDIKGDKAVFLNSRDAQDCWIFKGTIKKVNDCDFSLGIAGCDNAIADRLSRSGYHVINPSRTIKSYHLHESGVRNYNPNIKIPQPYKLIAPTL